MSNCPPLQRKCYKCGIVKTIDNFHKDRTRSFGISNRCKECATIARRKSWKGIASDSQKHAEYRRNYNQQKLKAYREFKKETIAKMGNKCAICGLSLSEFTPLACFEFHHKNPEDKEINISRYALPEKIRKIEAAKCIVVCVNCHRRIHFFGGIENIPRKELIRP